jgi:hypothetical protein
MRSECSSCINEMYTTCLCARLLWCMCWGAPGLHGGECAARGLNLLHISEKKADGSPSGEFRTVSLGGKNTVHVEKMDRVTVFTPGGGGYGQSTVVAGSGSGSGVDSGSQGGGGAGAGAGAGGEERGVVRPVKTCGSLHTFTASQESA